MGVPCIIIITAENQRDSTEALDEKGIGINLGWPQDLSVERITSPLKQLMMNAEEALSDVTKPDRWLGAAVIPGIG